VKRLADPRPPRDENSDAKTMHEDYFKNLRTRLVLVWLLTNAFVVGIMTNPQLLAQIQSIFIIDAANKDKGINPFLSFIFYSVLGISLIRFIGSTSYLIHRALVG
jgi:chitin synthase